MEVRPLSTGDAEWMARLMAARRAEYEAYSPVFWRPAHGVEELHVRFLAGLVENPANIALRNDYGFITAMPRDDLFYVDDFALHGESSWAGAGAALLAAAWGDARGRGASQLRVVTAQRDQPKVAMLTAAGMAIAERWWVKPLEGAAPGTAFAGPLAGDGYDGFLTAAPPVYDPGGPVAIVTSTDSEAALAAAESAARRAGAVLVILPIAAGAAAREDAACGCGFAVASEFYLGRPV